MKSSRESNCNEYEGYFESDLKNGFGIFQWASRNIYIGFFISDERNGIGEMRWTDGSKYIGQWKNGIQNGYGKMTFSDNSCKIGLFEKNIYKGKINPGAHVPPELLDPDFNIKDLAPPQLISLIEKLDGIEIEPLQDNFNSN